MLTIENVKLTDIVPFKSNAKLHPKEQVAQIVESIKAFGFNDPIAISETGEIIEGHGRLLAVKELGYTEVPCIRLTHLTEEQRRAYILAHNKLTMNTGFDADILLGEFDFLKGADFNTELTGFSMDEIEKMFEANSPKEIKEDDFDVDKAAAEPPCALPGDLWHLRRHRLLIGDSTKAEDITRLMDGNKANLVLTDPPYLIAYKGKAGAIKNDDLDDKAGYEFIWSALCQAENAMANDASIYVFHADTKGELFRRAFREAGFHLSMNCVWKKSSFTLGRMPYQIIHEPCLFGWKAKGTHVWNADRKQSTVWEFDKPHKNDIHATMKPVALLAYLIKNSTLSGCIVLDLFSGSFSTGMACQQLDRVCCAMEIDEKYASAAVKRFVAEYGADNVTVERGGQTLTYAEVAQ
jgi:DNA modification methylase